MKKKTAIIILGDLHMSSKNLPESYRQLIGSDAEVVMMPGDRFDTDPVDFKKYKEFMSQIPVVQIETFSDLLSDLLKCVPHQPHDWKD